MAKAGRDEDEAFEETPRSRPPRRPQAADDERDEERPKRRAARDDDDEEDNDRPRRRSDRDDTRSSKNGMALAGYYCGFLALIFSLGGFAIIVAISASNPMVFFQNPWLPMLLVFGMMYGLGGICGLLGIIFGAVGLSRVKHTNRGTGHSVVGIVLGALVILGLIAVLLLGFVNTRGRM